MTHQANLVSGDTGSTLRVTCRNKSDNSLLDLTNKTVNLKWIASDGVTLVTREMTVVVPATNGVAEYRFQSNDLYAHSMAFEVEVIDATSAVIRGLDLIKQYVREALA